MYKFGAHVSIAGGIVNAFERIENIGGNCMQMFSSSPRDWRDPVIQPEIIEQFVEIKNEKKIGPNYFHANYLVNFANKEDIGKRSIQNLIVELNLASQMRISGSVVHLGSFFDPKDQPINLVLQKYQIVVDNINRVLDQIPDDVYFLIENAGSRKIGVSLDEIGYIVSLVKDPRVKVCIDVSHLHAVGYEFDTSQQVDAFATEFDQKIGLSRLELFHISDNKFKRGSFLDRHENLGEGFIGLEVFKHFVNHPVLKQHPFILEVPGFDKKGPDKQNMDTLKSLAGKK